MDYKVEERTKQRRIELENSEGRLRELERQEDTETQKWCRGKKKNMPLVKNCINCRKKQIGELQSTTLARWLA